MEVGQDPNWGCSAKGEKKVQKEGYFEAIFIETGC
jgi:hypothetical protein